MWLEVVYRPTSLFSLRRSDATNPAAKTLFSPSPYAVKMALLNVAITFFSIETALKNFEFIKNLEIHFNLPKYLCANNCFIKIQKEPKKAKPGIVFESTVAFREYVYFGNDIKIIFKLDNISNVDFLKSLLIRINCFGKRGCFFQFIKFNLYDVIPDGYSYLLTKDSIEDGKEKILIKMDDFSKESTFLKVSTYSPESNNCRNSKIYCFNIKQLRANKNFTLYRKV